MWRKKSKEVRKLSDQLEIEKLQEQLEQYKRRREDRKDDQEQLQRIYRLERMLSGELAIPLVDEIERILKGKQKQKEQQPEVKGFATEKGVELIPTPISDEQKGVELKTDEMTPDEIMQEAQRLNDIADGVKPKRPYHRRRRQIKGKMINDSTAKRIIKKMRTTLLQHRYETIIDYLGGGNKSTIKNIAETTHISQWSVHAHLQYGIETGVITAKKKKGELKRFWLTKEGEELWNKCNYRFGFGSAKETHIKKEIFDKDGKLILPQQKKEGV